MVAVLGISAHYHDAAAALVVDGEVIAAMQEERFTRIKNDAALPIHAARACLARAGLKAGDLDAVVFYENPFAKLERVLLWLLRSFPRSRRTRGAAPGAARCAWRAAWRSANGASRRRARLGLRMRPGRRDAPSALRAADAPGYV